MGAWDTGSFESDEAADWIAGLKTIAPEELTKILTRAADDPNYLEGPAAIVAVSAAEVVAAATKRSVFRLSSSLKGDRIPG